MAQPEMILKRLSEQEVLLPAHQDRIFVGELGESVAFEDIFAEYKNLVYNLSLRVLGNHEDALDLSQEVFLTIHRKLHTFKGNSSLKTWIYRVTLNKASNRIRWWRVRRKQDTFSFAALGHSSLQMLNLKLSRQTDTPEQNFLGGEARDIYHRCLQKLPFKYRAVMVMRDLDDMTYEEISDSLGISLGTVKSRIARGREKLRELVEKFL
jgi:RNA polymerase sigma-70 factor (ECF subfamily)